MAVWTCIVIFAALESAVHRRLRTFELIDGEIEGLNPELFEDRFFLSSRLAILGTISTTVCVFSAPVRGLLDSDVTLSGSIDPVCNGLQRS